MSAGRLNVMVIGGASLRDAACSFQGVALLYYANIQYHESNELPRRQGGGEGARIDRFELTPALAAVAPQADDIRPDNPPSNPELLASLVQEFVAARYDLKSIYRLILNSQTYQLSSIPRSGRAEAAANFAYYPLRRLDAEVLADAICETTGTTETYTSAIPEPFTFIPEEQHAISLPDGSITSAFLELFGRPPRDTGLEAERNNRLTAAQQLHMLNASHVERKIEQSPKFQYLIRNSKGGQQLAAGLYLMILSRPPTAEELQAVSAYSQNGNLKPRDAAIDLAWALMNSAEFLYRH